MFAYGNVFQTIKNWQGTIFVVTEFANDAEIIPKFGLFARSDEKWIFKNNLKQINIILIKFTFASP